LAFLGASALLFFLLFEKDQEALCDDTERSEDKLEDEEEDREEDNCEDEIQVGKNRPELPTFTEKDIEQHKTLQDRVWVYYKDGVYDITDFLESHPGGMSKILLAAGGDLETYWRMYAQHLTQEVADILEVYRIGNIKREKKVIEVTTPGPYSDEPWEDRPPILKVNTRNPFNAEAPLATLTDFITPNEIFFIRNHLPVPRIKPEEYRLDVFIEDPTGQSSPSKVTFTLDELKSKFSEHTVVATLQCAGNRRSEQNRIKKVRGLEWTGGAISNAEWKGVMLIDVLRETAKKIGVTDPHIEEWIEKNFEHVQFEGADKDPALATYGASIPIDRAVERRSEVILAFEMNGKPLPRDHGYPVRVVVPGVVGARNVKWLNKIVVSKHESDSHWQQKDYKGFNSSIDWDNVNFKVMPAIQDLPVCSAICEPSNQSTLPPSVLDQGELVVKGYAYAGGGQAIIRVDVSIDGGETWLDAELLQPAKSFKELKRRWTWTQWQVAVPLPKESAGKKIEIICKAIDSTYNNQPENVGPIWNLRGVLNNSWHKIQVNVPEIEQRKD